MYSTSWNALIALDNTKGTVTDVVSCILLVFCVKKKPKTLLTTERHYNGSRPFQGRTEMQHSGGEGKLITVM